MEIISQLMATITQTNEWFRICNEDPQIQRASHGLQLTMARVSALVPEAIMDELWDALCNLEEAQESAAISNVKIYLCIINVFIYLPPQPESSASR